GHHLVPLRPDRSGRHRAGTGHRSWHPAGPGRCRRRVRRPRRLGRGARGGLRGGAACAGRGVARADARDPVLMCGMIGSNTGWVDAGYREVPCEVVVDPADLTPVPLPGHPAWIVPGLLLPGRAPDIMRGEETQALGALLDAGDG